MTFVVVKVGGAVSGEAAGAVLELAATDDVLVVHGAGPQISAEMERAGVPVEFVNGLRVTPPAGIPIVRASFLAVNEALCAAIGERAVRLVGDEIGLVAKPLPGLGLVGEVEPTDLPRVRTVLADGKIPVLAPIASGETGSLNVNADVAAAAIAIGMDADRLVFLTDVEGFLIDGRVVDSVAADHAEELLAGGTLEGGIIPKLSSAVEAARNGIPASIGRTAVTA
ncbi:MAG TPA: acetylglutamate kinase [Gaiellaceae bacterium]|nr:acetylglutamate kinase [Gaiellaceae bacterium]